ncbi:serine/threonine protein kinase [bacterium]|nr:serine/threonine protein kinase [bacterium]
MATTTELLELGSRIEVLGDGESSGTYSVYRATGSGGQGILYALVAPDGRLAALKVPAARGILSSEIERRILAKLPPHRNIIRLLGTATIQGVECSVLSWSHSNPFLRLNDPSMADATAPFRSPGSRRTGLPAMTVIEIVHEVLAALEHLHANGYVHGDVKASNVLIEVASPKLHLPNADFFTAIQQRLYRTRVIDFGTTRSISYLANMSPQDREFVPPEFTPLYAPPEVIRGVGTSRGGPEVDVYQTGMLLYELATGHYPYDHVDPDLAREGLNSMLLEVKRAEAQGVRRPFERRRITEAAQHDVVFAESFAAQRLRDRFYQEVENLIDLATASDPAKRPTVAALRARLIRTFELEARLSSR